MTPHVDGFGELIAVFVLLGALVGGILFIALSGEDEE